jgi:hypothetical protein
VPARARQAVPWQVLLEALQRRRDELAGQITGRMRGRLRAYRDLDPSVFQEDVAQAMEITIELAGNPRPVLTEAHTAVLEQVGEGEAQAGVPVEEMLLAWRIGVDLLVERGTEEAERLGLDAKTLLDFVRATLSSGDLGMATTARAHRQVELERDREAQDRRASFVRALLSGTTDPARLRTSAGGYGLDPARRYRAVRARPGPGGSTQQVQRAVGLQAAAEAGRGMSVLVDGDVAGFLLDPPGEVAPGRAGVGPAVPLDGLAESFRLAGRALDTLEAFGTAGTSDLAGLGLRAAVVADPDVGAVLRRRYLDPLAGAGSGSASASVLVTTLREYLAAGGHVETAAQRLHVHPNTLRYRLARFEELTGTQLRGPLTTFEVWWAVQSAALDGPIL